MRVHISSDIEGIATLCHTIQGDTKGEDFPRMREIMTGEVQAAIEGAKEGGATEILVCDAHDTGRNLLIEKLDRDVEVIEGSSYDFNMMAGISRDFDASFQIGYHSMRHTHAGVLGHSFSYSVAELRLNGIAVGESGLGAAIAGHFGVPVVLVSGDAHAVRQAKSLIKDLVEFPQKRALGSTASERSRQIKREN